MPAHDPTPALEADGYAIIRGALADEALAAFRAVIEGAVDARARELHRRGEIDDLREDEPFERRMALIHGGRDPGLRAWNSVAFTRELHALITQPRLLDAIEAALGPEIAFDGDYHLRPKLPRSPAGIVHWHQDSQYFGPLSERLLILTAVVALVDATEENGCLWVAPGSHRWGVEREPPGLALDAKVVERATSTGRPVVACPLRRGDVLLFGNLLQHGSFLNRGDGIRWTIDLRYSAAGALLDADGDGARFRERLECLGYTPFLARGRGRRPTSWEEWRARHLARNPSGLARMDRYAS
jgi:ectoine hydroxylase-related dioxygenase (phytanoyl-CoA dioxygenase family)